ncbi:hypothetical protein ACOTFH_29375, partial [Achromobacter xylosoxidans]
TVVITLLRKLAMAVVFCVTGAWELLTEVLVENSCAPVITSVLMALTAPAATPWIMLFLMSTRFSIAIPF